MLNMISVNDLTDVAQTFLSKVYEDQDDCANDPTMTTYLTGVEDGIRQMLGGALRKCFRYNSTRCSGCERCGDDADPDEPFFPVDKKEKEEVFLINNYFGNKVKVKADTSIAKEVLSWASALSELSDTIEIAEDHYTREYMQTIVDRYLSELIAWSGRATEDGECYELELYLAQAVVAIFIAAYYNGIDWEDVMFGIMSLDTEMFDKLKEFISIEAFAAGND